ncbi:OmpA/MotB family protein [Pelagibacterium montanilacus]|uniref:OmpA/MotB family protein n=1 Tax=Pelagibacterium montanilacus TaxID=2185280 RepID=UPI001FE8FBE3|nr:flagellar motor protein MotB [Pelagibacterium montanilacus]
MARAQTGGRKKNNKAEVPEWLVTFADLMSILVCFFVLIISFSIQDEQKLQIVAGSMREAFGVVQTFSRAAMIERDGNPEREHLKSVTHELEPLETQFASEDHDRFSQQGPEANTFEEKPAEIEQPGRFALAAASLRQAWRENPDITALSAHLILEETDEGLDIVIVDQEGRPMFPEGSRFPYEATRKAIAAMAPLLERMPNPIRISGHTAAGHVQPGALRDNWQLSFERANTTRTILEEFGLSAARVESVIGRADTQPYFANDPYLAANQRVSITLLNEEPPVPNSLEP